MSRLWLLMSGLAVCLTGCGTSTDRDTSRPADSSHASDLQRTMVIEGKLAYDTYCVGCHGETGDGNGVAAGFMHPRPRDFQKALYRFSSTRAGQLPTDDDLRRSITEGLMGSSMPPWNLLPDHTVDALIAYIKTFSPKWTERAPASSVPLVDDPYRSSEDKTAAIQRGEVIYHGYATCWTCHPSYVSEEKINEHLKAMDNPTRDSFRPDLHLAEVKVNAEEQFTYPPDFRHDFVRAGMEVGDLYRSIAAGITGTAMPTWVDSMAFDLADGTTLTRVDDLWALSYYVRSLIQERPAKLASGDIQLRDRKQTVYLDGEVPPPAQLPGSAPDAGAPFEEEEFDEDE